MSTVKFLFSVQIAFQHTEYGVIYEPYITHNLKITQGVIKISHSVTEVSVAVNYGLRSELTFGLVAGLTNWRLGYDPTSVHARFLVNEVLMEHVPSGTSALSSQYHSANASYSCLILRGVVDK